jgi:hypothetical protein
MVFRSKGPAGPFIPSSIAICPRVPDESGRGGLGRATPRAVAVFIQEFDAGLCQRGDDLLAGCWTASKIAAGRFEALGGWD